MGARHGVHRGGAGVAQYRQHRRAGGLTAARHLHGLGRRRQYAGHVGAGGGDAAPADSLPPTSANLTAYLNQFYEREKGRATAFPATLPADAQPFDLLVINICSLAWADMDAVNLQNHPLWSKMDIMFDSFNSATAYSGPAAIRLLRASCGQLSHHDLYQPVNQQCYLFDNLAKLGFKEQLMLDHSGVFGNFLKELREQGDMQAPLMSQAGIGNELTSFDGEPIYNDLELLTRWLDQQQKPVTAAPPPSSTSSRCTTATASSAPAKAPTISHVRRSCSIS